MLRAIVPAGEGACETPLKEIAELARRLWITATPGIVFGNGTLVPGAISRQEIEQLLGKPG